MAKRKKKTSQDEKENVESVGLQGQTNLGFEPCEPGDIVKTRSKEDISTLNKNLANPLEGENGENLQPKVTKKKKFKDKNSERIENDLFAGENKGKSKKSSTKKKRSTGKKLEQNTVCYFCQFKHNFPCRSV